MLSTTTNQDEMTTNQDYRSIARQLAIQFLYQLEIQHGETLSHMDSFLKEYSTDPKANDMAKELALGCWKNLSEIDVMISSTSENWQLKRIDLIDRSNIRLGAYQLMYCKEIPEKAVINEAIEIAKLFSTTQAPSFVNGVLDAIRKEINK